MSLLRRIEKNQQLPAERAPAAPERSTRLEDLRIRRAPVAPARDTFQDLKSRIHNKLIAELDPSMDVTKTDEVRQTIEEMYDALLTQENLILGRADRQRLLEQIVAEILGYGPIEPLLADDSVTEVMVNGPNAVYVERSGKVEVTDYKFENDDHVLSSSTASCRPWVGASTRASPTSTPVCRMARVSMPSSRLCRSSAPS